MQGIRRSSRLKETPNSVSPMGRSKNRVVAYKSYYSIFIESGKAGSDLTVENRLKVDGLGRTCLGKGLERGYFGISRSQAIEAHVHKPPFWRALKKGIS